MNWEMIAVASHTERALRVHAKAHVEDAHWIETWPRFRQAVLDKFESLRREGVEVTHILGAFDAEFDAADDAHTAV
jgi:hypothetical protein